MMKLPDAIVLCCNFLRLSCRRKINLFSGQFSFFLNGKGKTATPRSATPRKRKGVFFFVAIVSIFMAAYALFLQTNLFKNSAAGIEKAQEISVELISQQNTGHLVNQEELLAETTDLKKYVGPEFWPEMITWVQPGLQDDMLKLLAYLIICSLPGALLFKLSLGIQNGTTNSQIEWLLTFPVKPRVLFSALIAERAASNIFSFIFYTPTLLFMFIAAGFGWYSLPLAIIITLHLNIIMAAIIMAIECWLCGRLGHSTRKNMQAVAGVAAWLFLMPMYLLMLDFDIADIVVDISQTLSGTVLLFPPFLFCSGGETWLNMLLGFVVMVSTTFLVYSGGILLSEKIISKGLVSQPGSYRINKNQIRKESRRFMRASGITGRETVLVLRDLSLFFQSFLLPLLIIAFNMLVVKEISGESHYQINHISTAAFCGGAYSMLYGSFMVLNSEQQALWILYALPESITKILFKKTLFWTAIGCAVTTTIFLLGCWAAGIRYSLENQATAVIVLCGIFLYGLLAGGMGVLNTDPLEKEPIKRMEITSHFLFLMLVGLYLPVIYLSSFWLRFGNLILLVILVMAVWQRVRDRVPFFLDPVSSPPERIEIADGIVAVFAFFHIQGLILLLLPFTNFVPKALHLVAAYSVAGLVVATSTQYIFYRRGIFQPFPFKFPEWNILKTLVFKQMKSGCFYGLVAASFGGIYLFCLHTIPFLKQFSQDMAAVSLPASSQDLLYYAILAIGIAPILEEFIFRRLLFQGLARSLPRGTSLVSSAAIFAIVHPPISVIPVFVLGLAAAMAYCKTKNLLAPIITHTFYNILILGVNYQFLDIS